ncbi:MAG: polyprenyl synthetase family protein [Propionibacteriaceae bacterium]|jgi:geranylgeranyl diphosphate synthase type I|nr:polyprenyl synthetase family protein [Propionibacteriaceae bacterium]
MVFSPDDPLGAEWRTAVAESLAPLITQCTARWRGINAELTAFATVAADYLGGGKRVRPAFAYWAYVASAGQPADPQLLLQTLSALEFLHAGLLIHDDLIDDSPTRRGHPSAHVALAAAYPNTPDPLTWGRSAAVLLGTLLIQQANEVLTRSAGSAPYFLRATETLNATISEVLLGQQLDLLAEQSSDRSDSQLAALATQVDTLKTSSYTVRGPLQLGLALTDAPIQLKDALECYATHVGVGYQLRDDLLDLFGEPELTGKTPGGDIRRGKRTHLIAAATAQANAADKAILYANLGNPAADIAAVRAAVTRSGAAADIETRLSKLARFAAKALASAPLQPDARTALTKLAEQTLFRSA